MPFLGRVRYAQDPRADYWYDVLMSVNDEPNSWLRKHIENITGIKGLPDDLSDEQLWRIGMKNG
jgi:hypothetical protein